MAKRHGGLTALAVLNFVFGGIGAIGCVLGLGALALIREAMVQSEAAGIKYEGQSMTVAYAVLALSAVGALLLIVSGVGYLKQKKFLGRTLGTLYALLSLAGTGLTIATAGAGLTTVLFAVYPLLTLILLNSSFKEDLVN